MVVENRATVAELLIVPSQQAPVGALQFPAKSVTQMECGRFRRFPGLPRTERDQTIYHYGSFVMTKKDLGRLLS